MASDQPTHADVQRMAEIERHVIRAVASFRENTEAAIVAGALLRIVRHLYDLYPTLTRGQLVEGAVAFLTKRDIEAEIAKADMGFIIPKGIM